MERTPVEYFAPGEFIKDELEARGWLQGDLAEVMGRTEAMVSELINGKRSVTAKTAKELSAAFGTSAQVWLNLEAAYQLGKDRTSMTDVERRAKLHGYAPVKEMVRRGWLEPSKSLEVLEKQVREFFGVRSLDEPPMIQPHAARKSATYDRVSNGQNAWLIRGRKLAQGVPAKRYNVKNFGELIEALKPLMYSAEDVRLVPQILADYGVRLVLIEHLPGTKVDGATLWLSPTQPVVLISTRYDRIDAFWFTLMHELDHVRTGDGREEPVLDSEILEGQKRGELPENERQSNEFAREALVPESEIADFIRRVSPYYSRPSITGFARRIEVHPGVVVGQLQFREELTYSQLRKLLVPVRGFLAQSAMTDGWGHIAN